MKPLSLVVVLLLVAACLFHREPIESVSRPNTLHLQAVIFDTLRGNEMIQKVFQNWPLENAVCIDAVQKDTTMSGKVVPYLVATRIRQASIKDATPTGIEFQHNQGCADYGMLGIAHMHGIQEGQLCANSEIDAEFIFKHPLVLYSIVLCNTHRAELLWQDGRRIYFSW